MVAYFCPVRYLPGWLHHSAQRRYSIVALRLERMDNRLIVLDQPGLLVCLLLRLLLLLLLRLQRTFPVVQAALFGTSEAC